MRIAVFTDIYAPWGAGGIASSVSAQKEELERRGHEVVVFCPGFKSREKNVVTVPTHRFFKVNGACVAKRPAVVKKYILEKYPNFTDFDIVHVHYEASCSLAGVELAQEYDLPLVQTMHGREDMAIAINVKHPFKTLVATVLTTAHGYYILHPLKVRRDKFQAPTLARAQMWKIIVNQAECADVVVTPSEHFARKLEHYGVSKPIVAVSNGVPKSLLDEKFTVRKMKDGDVLKMLWNSRVSKEKRIMPFLQALRILKRPYLVYIYGDGNELRKARKYAKKHKLKVKFFGAAKREKIIARMRDAHLGVMASYNFDTQGLTLLESEATGLPVFFCDPAMMEVVPQGSFVLAQGPEAAAMAISLDDLPADRIEEMSRLMLKHRKEAMQETQVVKLVKVYRLAIARKRALLKELLAEQDA